MNSELLETNEEMEIGLILQGLYGLRAYVASWLVLHEHKNISLLYPFTLLIFVSFDHQLSDILSFTEGKKGSYNIYLEMFSI